MVLVVDDDDDLRAVLVQVLNRAGYQTVAAPSAETAIAAMRDTRPCVVLTDIELSGMSGFELRALMRSDWRTRDIPVLFMTGGAPDLRQAPLAEMPDHRVLHKPVALRALCAALERRFGSGRCRENTPAATTRPLRRNVA